VTDMQVQDQAVNNDGSNRSGVTSTTRTSGDPATGTSTQLRTVRAWSGRAPGVEIVWLVAGVVLAFLALDFIFHATGANKVGFAAFVYGVGSFLAAPFAGIFKTGTARGDLIVWADVLAMVIYLLIAAVVVRVVTMIAARNASTT
jgi:hypothetical protein